MKRRAVLLLVITVAILGIVALPSVAGLSEDGTQAADLDEPGPAAQTTDCSSCHEDGSALAEGPENEEVCSNCHSETTAEFKESVHYGSDSHADISCVACHDAPEDSWFTHFRAGPHGSQNPDLSYAPKDSCSQAGCHDSENEHGPVYAEWNETEDDDWSEDMVSHSKPTAEYARTKECSPCHGTHEGVFANLEDATGVYERAHDSQPAPENVSEWRITCAACHDPHTASEENLVDSLRGDYERTTDVCAQCHNAELGHEISGEVTTSGEEVHHSMWEMYRNSKYIDNSSSHPQLECTSCHMASRDIVENEQGETVKWAMSGHSFDVNTTLLESEELMEEDYRKCANCHQDLDATIQEQERITQKMADVAHEMQQSSNETIHEYGYADNTELTNTWEQGRFWLNFVEAGGTGIHNPEMANARLSDSISNFQEVRSQAYEERISELESQVQEQETTETTTETTESSSPGLGIGIAMIALLGATLLAVRRNT